MLTRSKKNKFLNNILCYLCINGKIWKHRNKSTWKQGKPNTFT